MQARPVALQREGQVEEVKEGLRKLGLEDLEDMSSMVSGYYKVSKAKKKNGQLRDDNEHSFVLETFKDIIHTIKMLVSPDEFLMIASINGGDANIWNE